MCCVCRLAHQHHRSILGRPAAQPLCSSEQQPTDRCSLPRRPMPLTSPCLLAAFLSKSERRPSCVMQAPFGKQLSHRYSIKRHRAARWLIASTLCCVYRPVRPASSFDPWTSGGPMASHRAAASSSRPTAAARPGVRCLSLRLACSLPSSVEARGDPAASRKPPCRGDQSNDFIFEGWPTAGNVNPADSLISIQPLIHPTLHP